MTTPREESERPTDRALWALGKALQACSTHLCECKPRAEIKNPAHSRPDRTGDLDGTTADAA